MSRGDGTGGPADGYESLVHGAGAVLWDHGAVDVSGTDAREFLNGQLSADVRSLGPGEACESLSLSPQGKLQGVGRLLCLDESRFRYLVDRASVGPVVDALEAFKVRVDVEIRGARSLDVRSMVGPEAGTAVSVLTTLPDEPLTFVREGLFTILKDSEEGLGGFVVVSEEEPPELEGVVIASPAAVDARRVEIGFPLFGVDYDTGTIPHDAGLVPRAVSLEKGCYTGQELVERIWSRGRPNRRPRRVRLSGETVPTPGAELEKGGKVVGALTTTAWCPEWDSPGGLGLVRVELEPGDQVAVTGAGAAMSGEVLP